MKSVCLFFLSLFSVISAFANCGEGNLFAINPSQTYSVMQTAEEKPRILAIDIATGKAIQLADPKMKLDELFFTDDNHVLAVGSEDAYGPFYKVWDLRDGSMTSFKNRYFRDFSGGRTNLSKNMKYAVTSGPLAFGGYGYAVIDLETGMDIQMLKLTSGLGQISDDAKTLYFTDDYNSNGSTILNTYDIASRKITSSASLHTSAAYIYRLSWAGDYLVLHNSYTVVFDTKTNKLIDIPDGRPLLDWSKDFSMRVSGDISNYSENSYFEIYEANLNKTVNLNTKNSIQKVRLSLDSKRVAMMSRDGEMFFYDTTTGQKTETPSCHE